jgi:predicted ATP-dependent endonuclease of OLD family
MDLCSVEVSGFRRFSTREKLRTNGKLVALLGPNEAGKSSLLHAISLLIHDDPPLPSDISRGTDPSEFSIDARFFLSNEDIAAAELTGPAWLTVTKKIDGRRRLSITPRPDKRDLQPRHRLRQAIFAASENQKFLSRAPDGLIEDFEGILKILSSDSEDISAENLAAVLEFVEVLSSVIAESDSAAVRSIPVAHSKFHDLESKRNPQRFALNALLNRLPDILMFDEDERNLLSEYDIEAIIKDTPVALQNLCAIAKLEIDQLRKFRAESNTAAITTIERRANKELEERFSSDWKQSGISVNIRIQNDRLLIQVVNTNQEFTSFAERSDGLRQFVALQTFTAGIHNKSAILLIDEADQKLHYDAQADLVQMLARQNLAYKVVYTTHSAGCLPEDLGNGVRFARPRKEDETRSEIVNKFWTDNEPGFAPLLIGMGASTLAFFPTRHAVMVEGPSDMLLLPTMLREALDTRVLGFQFVPGLSSSNLVSPLHPAFLGGTSRIAYLIDGDEGAEKLRKNLIEAGVPRERVFSLSNTKKTAVEIEDFIDPTLLIDASNSILRKLSIDKPLKVADIGTDKPMEKLESVFFERSRKKISKVELAYEILEILSDFPERRSLAVSRKLAVKGVAERLVRYFESNVHGKP